MQSVDSSGVPLDRMMLTPSSSSTSRDESIVLSSIALHAINASATTINLLVSEVSAFRTVS